MVLGSQFRVTELASPNFVYMQRNKKLGLGLGLTSVQNFNCIPIAEKPPTFAYSGHLWCFFVYYFGYGNPIHFKSFPCTSTTGSQQLYINWVM